MYPYIIILGTLNHVFGNSIDITDMVTYITNANKKDINLDILFGLPG